MRSKNVTHLKHFHRLNSCLDEHGSVKEGREKDFRLIAAAISNDGWILEEIISNLVEIGMDKDVADQVGNRYFYL